MIVALVEAGLGIGVVPGLALLERGARIETHFTEPAMSRRVVVVLRSARRHHPAVESALAQLLNYGAQYVPVQPTN